MAKEECSLTGMKTNVHKIGSKSTFLHMEHFWDLLFQLMKHGPNTLHVPFIFLFSIVRTTMEIIF